MPTRWLLLLYLSLVPSLVLAEAPSALIVNGSALVPLRAVAEWLGARVSFDRPTGVITLTAKDTVLRLVVNSTAATVNGAPATLAAAARFVGGIAYVPVRFVSEQLGARATWDARTRAVTVTAPGRAEPLVLSAAPSTDIYAAIRRRADIRPLLRDDPSLARARDANRQTPLHEAARVGNVEAAKLLLAAGADATARDDADLTPLHVAAATGQCEIADLLLANGAEINRHDSANWTPLHWAIIEGKAAMAELLLKRGADRGARTPDNLTPLHWAVEKGRKEIVAVLLARGVDINARDNYGRTPLHYAVSHDLLVIANLLLKKRADPNAQDDTGSTPLHLVAREGRAAMAALLTANEADLSIKDDDGLTPLHYAIQQGHTAVVDIFRTYGKP